MPWGENTAKGSRVATTAGDASTPFSPSAWTSFFRDTTDSDDSDSKSGMDSTGEEEDEKWTGGRWETETGGEYPGRTRREAVLASRMGVLRKANEGDRGSNSAWSCAYAPGIPGDAGTGVRGSAPTHGGDRGSASIGLLMDATQSADPVLTSVWGEAMCPPL